MRNSTPPIGSVPPELPLLARELHRSGRWSETLDRARFAAREFREDHADEAIGSGLIDDILAGELARIVGADIHATRAAFRRTNPTIWGAVLAELQAMLEPPKSPAIKITTGGRRRA